MQVAILNKLLNTTTTVIQQMTNIQFSMNGKPELVNSPVAEESVCVMVGTTGALRGQVILSYPESVATELANAMMMGMGTGEFDEMAKSAIRELGNMILGNFSTAIYAEHKIDITPPTLIQGSNLSFSGTRGIKVALLSQDKKFEMAVTVMMVDK